jgi:hypothetical protein
MKKAVKEEMQIEYYAYLMDQLIQMAGAELGRQQKAFKWSDVNEQYGLKLVKDSLN